jgi:hypothetical protein
MIVFIDAVYREPGLVLLQDGTLLPITNWYADGEECGAAEATSCVAGPMLDGKWVAIDLTTLQAPTLQ